MEKAKANPNPNPEKSFNGTIFPNCFEVSGEPYLNAGVDKFCASGVFYEWNFAFRRIDSQMRYFFLEIYSFIITLFDALPVQNKHFFDSRGAR